MLFFFFFYTSNSPVSASSVSKLNPGIFEFLNAAAVAKVAEWKAEEIRKYQTVYLTYMLPQKWSIGTYQNISWHKNQIVCNTGKKGVLKKRSKVISNSILTQCQSPNVFRTEALFQKQWNTQTRFNFLTIQFQILGHSSCINKLYLLSSNQ